MSRQAKSVTIYRIQRKNSLRNASFTSKSQAVAPDTYTSMLKLGWHEANTYLTYIKALELNWNEQKKRVQPWAPSKEALGTDSKSSVPSIELSDISYEPSDKLRFEDQSLRLLLDESKHKTNFGNESLLKRKNRLLKSKSNLLAWCGC